MIENATLQDRIENCSSRVDSAYWAIDSNREDDVVPTTAFRSLGLDCLEIAGCELQLGNIDSARQWFARATYAERSYVAVFTRHYDELPTSNQHNGSTRALAAIENAILTGDARLIETTAQDVLDLSDYPYEFLGSGETYYKACVLSALSTGDMTVAEQYRDYCEDAIEEMDEYLDALLQTYDGLIEDNSMAVQTGLQAMVDYHADAADDLSRWLQVMSPAVGTLLLLARHCGMNISVDSWYVPDGLWTYGIDEQIDLPRPEYSRDELLVDD
jgi:hypothetical protein